MAPQIRLLSRISNPEVLRGKKLTTADVAVKLEADADVYKPNGEMLCALRRRAIPEEVCVAAYPALHELRKYTTNNRGAYSGAARVAAKYPDGTLSKNTRTRAADGKSFSVASAIIGYYDRQGGRFPFCRETIFTARETAHWNTVLPMVAHVNGVFKQTLPKRYAAQEAFCKSVPKDYIIKGTTFTTLTVNNNVAPSATHTDAGDLKAGFGIISTVCRGAYTGAWLVFPEFFVGVELRDGDVFFFNSHDWHGVTPMEKLTEDAERISVVYYAREKMKNCLPMREELARAQGLGMKMVEE